MAKDPKFHPAAKVFPLMSASRLAELAADIKANGLLEAITLDADGLILDGRNRFRACKKAKVKPEYLEYDGDDPIGFMVSMNVHRRHLSESQRSMIAAKLANLAHGQKKADTSIDVSTQDEAASLLNVSTPSVQRARRIQEKGVPALAKAVESGDLSVGAASEIAALTPAQQRKVLKTGPKQATKTAAELRKAKVEAGKNFDPKKIVREAPEVRWSACIKQGQQFIRTVPTDCFDSLKAKEQTYFRDRVKQFRQQLHKIEKRISPQGKAA